MTGTFLDAYKCKPLPKALWRISYPGCQSRRDWVTGDILASDTTYEISDVSDLKRVAESHFCWDNRDPSCFVSVMSDWNHVVRWAYRVKIIKRCDLDKVYISEIDTTKLPAGTCLFDAPQLAAEFGFIHPWSEHELVFLHAIPHEAIISTQRLQRFEEMKEAEEAEKTEEVDETEWVEVAEVVEVVEDSEGSEESEEADDSGICDIAINDWTSSADERTDLEQLFANLHVVGPVLTPHYDSTDEE
ncbi:hypothetical protein J3F83DRAFT_744786 [Trichoderma novae-zelandiae]